MSNSENTILVEVVYARPDEQQLIEVRLASGTGARDALMHVLEHKLLRLSDIDTRQGLSALPLGVYGLQVDDDYVLKKGDRLEIYRPLLQDPKERRRQLARQSAQARTSRRA